MLSFFKNVFKKGELRRRIIFTLGMLFVFRLGAAITIPSINAGALTGNATNSGILGIMNMLGGGMLERFSIFSLGVSPYITASIIIELLSMDVIPVLAQWQKEGNTGKKKKDKVTRYVTLVLAAIQGGSLTYAFDKMYNILNSSSIWTYVYVVIVMMAGSMLAMWIGDQITQKGVGNGTSLLIFTGIVSNLPTNFITTFNNLVSFDKGTQTTVLGILWYVLFVVVYLAIVIFVVFNEGAVRKIPIMYATNSNPTMRTKDTTHMPIKINSSGVLPVIFAASVLAAPRTIISFLKSTDITKTIDTILNYQQPIGFCLYLIMIVLFAFFYSNLQIDSHKISDDLKKNGGSIPGVRTGLDTEKYISTVLNRVTVVGSIFLVIIAAIPIMTPVIWSQTSNAALTLGGTGLIIITGVALETTKQIKTLITRKEYHGYIRK
ncbi:MAG: preprotein translocase subunit SecY [Longibaculum muris]|uniref:Protein translocase subunit SecY n=1 Tax=Longibaculum muris TaxID=1796628 RepID=A0A4R3YFW0_9FIRM|nr:preprotein translocase subunit SecY [Longibaculum muris]KXU48646.1 preprotein translocase, SecY subunit [Candidatus Stoquefichus sp. KLE1796]MBS5370025.1 preprotein translocase subunit SecY [Coprobacillus cateniformis]MCR1889434.1 preprotein translocase subunit SecY [Longibaculum muris]MED9812053.1 preprotein translocase subunit SecY [Longibaculum muris]TCV91020.1 protein translocase subunit secY/sec61 alpha [Longibaculum muris]